MRSPNPQSARHPKLAWTLLVGASLVISGCGGEDEQSNPENDSGSGGVVGSTGGVVTGGAASTTGGSASGGGGVGGGSGGATGGTGAGGASGGVSPGTGGATAGGTGGEAAGGTSGGSTGGTGAGTNGGAGGGTGGTGGATGGDGGSAGGAMGDGGSAGSATGGNGGDGGSAGGAGGATGGDGGSSGATGGSAGAGSPGCGTPIPQIARNVQQTIEVDGTTRYYLLHVPAQADNQTPLMLIFGLHGYDMNNVAVAGLYDFTERSNGQAITVLPYGEGPPPGDVSHWGDQVLQSTWQGNEANYNFIRALMTDLENRFCIDVGRVFIAGFSMGGFFTNTLACAHGDWFRGFAPIAGGGPTTCAEGVTPAIMIHHGTADDIVDISSGEGSRDFWVEQNGCAQTSTPSYSGCESYDGCPDASPVVWCVGNFNHTITSSTAGNIWSFFSGLR
ncbi:MAG TPA: hypothetical protein PLU22_01570 [Polyangiaceae bacterium]|nr:hypothetical protein [Polyangiaceae bacterium]